MKKFLLCLLQAVFVCGLVSCEKGLENEAGFITPGNPEIPTNDQWEWSDTYPGPVNSQLEKIDTTVSVIGQYKPIPYSPETPILQSTGLYVGLDEVVNIDVPSTATGLRYQIGLAHNLATGQAQRRYGNVVKKGALVPGQINQVSSNFGGYLYFYYEPEDVAAAQASVDVSVSGAYQSLDYFKGSDQQTQAYYVRTIKERNEKLRDTSVGDDECVFLYWTELRSPKIILTFGLKEMYYLVNPDRLLEQYENLVDAFLDFGGYPSADNYELPVFRVYADVQLPNPKQTIVTVNNSPNYDQDERKYGGYPIGVLKHTSMRGTDVVDEARYMNDDQQLNFGYANGANTQSAFVPYAFGITVLSEWAKAAWMKYPLLRLANHYYCQYISDFGDFWGSQAYTNKAAQWRLFLKENRPKSPEVNHWATTSFTSQYNRAGTKHPWFKSSFVNTTAGLKVDASNVLAGDIRGTPNPTGVDDANLYEGRRVLVFLQLVQRYGWGIIKYINQRSIELGFKNEYEQDAHDFFVMAASEYAQEDLRPFFRWWWFPYTAVAAQFMRQYPELTKDYEFTASDGVSRQYYFFDWPGAGDAWFPNDKPQVNPDKWPSYEAVPKSSLWPAQKAYYQDVTKEEEWTAYVEVVQANRDYPDPEASTGGQWRVEYNPNIFRTSNTDTEADKRKFVQAGISSSTYLWYNCAYYGKPQKNEGNKARLLVDNGWDHGTAGAVGFMKGGTGMGDNATNPSRGNDTTQNWAIVDIDFKRPIKFNAIKFRQERNNDKSQEGNAVQMIVYMQYYVEPEYEWIDPEDPTQTPVTIRSGSVNGVYNYAPDTDPRRAIYYGYNDPRNTVPYPGRTMNMRDDGEPATNNGGGNNNVNGDEMKYGNWGFHPKDASGNPQGYFAMVYPRTILLDHRKSNTIDGRRISFDDQDWYSGVIWLIRDLRLRSYVYYLEDTFETRRVRLFLRSGIGHRLGDNMSYATGTNKPWECKDNSWRMRIQEISFGLVSAEDVEAPGQIPAPMEYFKGMESGDYPEVTARNYGGSGNNSNAAW